MTELRLRTWTTARCADGHTGTGELTMIPASYKEFSYRGESVFGTIEDQEGAILLERPDDEP